MICLIVCKTLVFQDNCKRQGNLLLLLLLLLLYADSLINACKDIGLAVNTGKTKYMEIGRHRGMIANAHIFLRKSENI